MGRPPGPGAGAPRGSATNAAERCPVRRPRTSTRLGASLRSPAATLALALAAALLGGCGAAPVASPRSTTTTGTSAAPGASAAAGAVASSGSGTSGGASGAPYDWTAAQLPRLGGGASTTLAAIVPPGTTGGVWSVVGTVTGAGGATTATVWVSSDGRAWTPERLAGTDGRALGAAADGSRTIVVGSVGRGARRRAEVWITPGSGGPPRPVADQASLRAAIGGRSGATAASAMDLVAAGTVGIVASGTVGGRSALWYSSDGTTWSQEPVAERLFGRRHATLSALAVDPNGILAAGTAHDGTRYAAVLWGSPNGIRWAEVGSFGPPGDHAVAGLAWNGRELVAAGGARESAAWSPAAWVSPGAGAWSEPIEAFPRSFPAAGTRPSVLRAVAADPVATAGSDSLVAAGGAPGSPELWTSVDGQVWAPLPLPSAPPGATADLVGVRGSTTVVADSEPGQPLVWVRRAGRWATVPPSSFGGLRSTATPVALARAQGRLWLAVDVTRGASPVGRAVILASVGGRRWSPAAVLAGARLSDLTAGATGLVATGTFGSRPAVWTSPDGTRWSHPDSLPGALSATAAAEVSGSTVVVGTTRLDRGAEPTAGAWHSTAAGWSPLGTLATTPTLDPQRPLAACAAAVPAAASTGTTSTTSPTAGSTGSATGGSGGGSAATTVVAAVGWSTRTGPPPTGGSRSSTATTIPVAGSGPGVGGQQDNGTQAAAWWLAGGAPRGAATISPHPGVGSSEVMDGCTHASGGFVAWGQSPGTDGAEQPALWRSTDATNWTRVLPARQGSAPAGPGGPWTDLAVSGDRWLAVGGSPPAALALADDPRWAAGAPYPPAGLPASVTAGYGTAGVWLSDNAGRTWRLESGGTAPWAGSQVSTTVDGWAGATPVVAGEVGGSLAVWVGEPAHAATPPASATGTSPGA